MKRLPDPSHLRVPATGDPKVDDAMQVLADYMRDMLLVQGQNNEELARARNPTEYTLATLPPATLSQVSKQIWVRDATGGPITCYTRGDGVWRRIDNNAQVT